MSDFEKFKELLPSKEKFYSLLTGKKISGKEYERVLKVWNKFEMKTMKNVFEKFRNNSLKNYGLYPNHYFSTPALRWNAMLNMTKIKLVLISDPKMYIFFEKGMRSGVSYISNGYSKASKKYLECYDPKQESKHIIYLDANNFVWLCNV